MKAITQHMPHRLLALLKSLGPYAAIELVLPGGSLIALALLAYRYHHTHPGVRT